jgi:hypothetical protein
VPARPKLSDFYYHLEPGAEDVPAFFIFLDHRIDRIELASVAFEYVMFRAVYPQRSYLFGFRRGYPYNYPDRTKQRIRLAPETYQVLYHLANMLIAAVFCGVQPNYAHKKGWLRIETGESLKLCSLLPSVVTLETRTGKMRRAYVYRRQYGEYYFEGSIDEMSAGMRRFLTRFLPLAMGTYRPYERKLGEQLDPLALYPNLEAVPPRKERQLRHKRNVERLTAQGKPPKLKSPKLLEPMVQQGLFELRRPPP